MSEPTIDEMLMWLDTVDIEGNVAIGLAIRAILEQHRPDKDWVTMTTERLRIEKREAIRAFVERVKKRYRNEGTMSGLAAMLDELAALEGLSK